MPYDFTPPQQVEITLRNTMRFPDGISLDEVRAVRTGADVFIEFGTSRVKIQDGNARSVIDKFEFYDRELPAGLSELPN